LHKAQHSIKSLVVDNTLIDKNDIAISGWGLLLESLYAYLPNLF
jgi:hypothetical protein